MFVINVVMYNKNNLTNNSVIIITKNLINNNLVLLTFKTTNNLLTFNTAATTANQTAFFLFIATNPVSVSNIKSSNTVISSLMFIIVIKGDYKLNNLRDLGNLLL
jgi:hypothetical protein